MAQEKLELIREVGEINRNIFDAEMEIMQMKKYRQILMDELEAYKDKPKVGMATPAGRGTF